MIDLFTDNCQILDEETFSEYLNRYKGFGKELYSEIETEIPVIFKNLKFYKAVQSTEKCAGFFPQIQDSYAHFYTEKLIFRIYLDPESEVVGVHNYDFTFEVDHWSEFPIKEVIDFMKKKLSQNYVDFRIDI